jgi:hypothetical protein
MLVSCLILAPRGGRGFVAPRSQTRVRRVSRSPGPEARGRPKTVQSPGPSWWRSPRRGSHPSKSSLRRQPRRITAAVASLPLPSRRSGSKIRLGDAPIRRSGPPRHRARGAFTPPKRRGTAAHDPRRPKSHRSATWAGRSDQGRGGSTPSDPSRPESERPKTPSLVLPRPEPQSVARGCIASTEAGGMRVCRIIAERFGFEALLRRRSSLSSGHRCRRPTLVPSMGFVPLRGSFVLPVRSGGAWPATSETEASKGGSATPDAQARRGRRISGIPLRVHPRRRAGALRRDVTGEAEAWPRTGAFSARRSWPPCRDPAGEPTEAGFAAKPVPGESVRSTSREGLVRDALEARPPPK